MVLGVNLKEFVIILLYFTVNDIKIKINVYYEIIKLGKSYNITYKV